MRAETIYILVIFLPNRRAHDPIPEDDPGRFGSLAVADLGRFLQAFGVVLLVLTVRQTQVQTGAQ